MEQGNKTLKPTEPTQYEFTETESAFTRPTWFAPDGVLELKKRSGHSPIALSN